MIEISRLHELFTYNRETGEVFGLRAQRVLTGECLTIDGAKIKQEEVIWAMIYEEWPLKGYIIDHKDRNPKNRRINNLRLATYSQNGFNMASRNPLAKGVTFDANRPSKPWRAQARVNGKKVNLGRYETMEEAEEAYKKIMREHQGEFACYD